jgi:hypothetical protein
VSAWGALCQLHLARRLIAKVGLGSPKEARYMESVRDDRRSATSPGSQAGSASGQVPLLDRFFPPPLAAKVPEVILLFWVVKILTPAGRRRRIT